MTSQDDIMNTSEVVFRQV